LENKLRLLYALQTVDNKLDEIEDLKGDLPAAVRELEEVIATTNDTISANDAAVAQAYEDRTKGETDITTLTEKIERYKNQQFQVRNNKEYDMLTREIDNAEKKITSLETHIDELAGVIQKKKSANEDHQAQLEKLNETLAERKAELAEVSKETDKEESALKHERDKIVHKIAKADLATYMRIRKAKQGRAVVAVKRGACAGCFNAVPPQRVLELRKNSRIYTCEGCGRILVSDEIVESSNNLL
jgi:uncharacterized protein